MESKGTGIRFPSAFFKARPPYIKAYRNYYLVVDRYGNSRSFNNLNAALELLEKFTSDYRNDVDAKDSYFPD